MEGAKKILDGPAVMGYVCGENFERLRRCEELARRKGTTVTAIATKWIFSRGLDVYAVMSAGPKHMADNAAALELKLSEAEADYLDLQTDKAL